ncbi:MAG TPA: hypothetical protein VKR58_05785 [Aquella sp.]|nr:hypothetical protein [Aquella sp.]
MYNLGTALAGALVNPPWPETVPLPLEIIKSSGCNFVSLPINPAGEATAALSGPVLSTSKLTLQSAAQEIVAASLGLVTIPHNDPPGATDAIRLEYFLNFSTALLRFTQICQVLPKGTMIELWNEATYSEVQSGTYNLTWNSVITLYENALQLVAIARQYGLLVVMPAPLDQSPEQTLLMQQNNAFPWEQMAALKADYLSYHMYDIYGGLPFRTRLKTCTDTAEELGIPLIITETNFGPDPWKIIQTEKEYKIQGIAHSIYQYIMDPPSTSDFSNTVVQIAIQSAINNPITTIN